VKKIIMNNSDLEESEITEVVTRVKALIINSNDEILLGYSDNIYQFPGGHVEKNEKLLEALNREVCEETGISLNVNKLNPFVCNYGYYKNWPDKGKNRKIEIYYYIIFTDELPNLERVKYTENEKKGNFELKYIKLNEFKKVLRENMKKYENSYGIAKEMLDVFEIYEKSNIE